MHFVVGFVEHEDAEARTKHVEARILGIVRSSYGVHVHLFHEHHVLFGPVEVHCLALVRRPVVVVYAFYKKPLFVEDKLALCRVYPELLEAEVGLDCFKLRAAGVGKFEHKVVEVRSVGAP